MSQINRSMLKLLASCLPLVSSPQPTELWPLRRFTVNVTIIVLWRGKSTLSRAPRNIDNKCSHSSWIAMVHPIVSHAKRHHNGRVHPIFTQLHRMPSVTTVRGVSFSGHRIAGRWVSQGHGLRSAIITSYTGNQTNNEAETRRRCGNKLGVISGHGQMVSLLDFYLPPGP